jgi:transcriptional regulator GlxA family with amidase domain
VRCAGEHQERRAKDLMVASLNEDISLLRLAAECGLSARHFARAFRQSTGLSPHRWLIQYRVERARELVADRRLSLIEIALICGFADQSHFTRAFTAIVAPQRQRPRLEEVAAGWAQFLAKASP